MGGQAVLNPSENPEDEVGAGEIEETCGNVELVDREGPGNQYPSHPSEIEQGDDGNEGGGLKEKDYLVGIGGQRNSEGLGQDDAPIEEPAAHAHGAPGLDLSVGNGLDRAPQDFRRIGGGVQGEGQYRAEIGFAKPDPQTQCLQLSPQLPGRSEERRAEQVYLMIIDEEQNTTQRA